MKIAIVTDQHFGARSDSSVLHEYFAKFYSEVFFPYIEEHKIDTVFDLGDTFDRRKYVNFYTLSRSKEYWFDKLAEKNIKLTTLVGNHCIPYKNTLSINALELLLKGYDNVTIVSEPQTVYLDGVPIALVPWICDDNINETFEMIRDTPAQICFGHLELGGFEMYKGSMHNEGMEADLFGKFDLVCSGHYHHKSTRGNINYLGTAYEMTWSDYNDPKGFHIFDTETRELTFIENPFKLFHKIVYDDSSKTMKDLLEADFSIYKNTYLKVIVKEKSNPYWFDLFIEALEKAGTVNIQVVDDNLNLNLEVDDAIIDEAESTETILKKYVDNLELDTNKEALQSLLRDLYNEAINLEQ